MSANVNGSNRPRTGGQPIVIANLELRPDEMQLFVEGVRTNLTVREFQLFMILTERLDTVVQRPEIYALMWGSPMPRRDRSVDVLVRKVRGKLQLVAPEWAYIHTHFGIGYRLGPERVADMHAVPDVND